jgi:hypothetical protein
VTRTDRMDIRCTRKDAARPSDGFPKPKNRLPCGHVGDYWILHAHDQLVGHGCPLVKVCDACQISLFVVDTWGIEGLFNRYSSDDVLTLIVIGVDGQTYRYYFSPDDNFVIDPHGEGRRWGVSACECMLSVVARSVVDYRPPFWIRVRDSRLEMVWRLCVYGFWSNGNTVYPREIYSEARHEAQRPDGAG